MEENTMNHGHWTHVAPTVWKRSDDWVAVLSYDPYVDPVRVHGRLGRRVSFQMSLIKPDGTRWDQISNADLTIGQALDKFDEYHPVAGEAT